MSMSTKARICFGFKQVLTTFKVPHHHHFSLPKNSEFEYFKYLFLLSLSLFKYYYWQLAYCKAEERYFNSAGVLSMVFVANKIPALLVVWFNKIMLVVLVVVFPNLIVIVHQLSLSLYYSFLHFLKRAFLISIKTIPHKTKLLKKINMRARKCYT